MKKRAPQRGSIFGGPTARGDVAYLSGALLKKSKRGEWQPRYFEIRGHYFVYRKGSNASGPVLGGVDLAGALSSVEETTWSDDAGRVHACFRVVGLDSGVLRTVGAQRALRTIVVRDTCNVMTEKLRPGQHDSPSLHAWGEALRATRAALLRAAGAVTVASATGAPGAAVATRRLAPAAEEEDEAEGGSFVDASSGMSRAEDEDDLVFDDEEEEEEFGTTRTSGRDGDAGGIATIGRRGGDGAAAFVVTSERDRALLEEASAVLAGVGFERQPAQGGKTGGKKKSKGEPAEASTASTVLPAAPRGVPLR